MDLASRRTKGLHALRQRISCCSLESGKTIDTVHNQVFFMILYEKKYKKKN